jgi:hypothetical protein
MKPHPRIRKTIKWGGAAMTVLLVVVWIGSGWAYAMWQIGWFTRVDVRGGVIAVRHAKLPGTRVVGPGWRWGVAKTDLQYTADWDGYFGGRVWRVDLPLWALATAAAVVSVLAWHLDTLARRRTLPNLCPKCNYDRAGLAEGAACPECGSTPSRSPAPS